MKVMYHNERKECEEMLISNINDVKRLANDTYYFIDFNNKEKLQEFQFMIYRFGFRITNLFRDHLYHSLILACVNGHLDIVKKILYYKKDLINYKKNNKTCLDYAKSARKTEVVEYLQKYIDFDAKIA